MRRKSGGSPILVDHDDVARERAQRASPERGNHAWMTVRDAYEFYRENCHRTYALPVYTLPARYGKELWQQVDRSCAARGVAATRFVGWAVRPLTVPASYPEPTNLMSQSLLDEYLREGTGRERVLSWRLKTGTQFAESHYHAIERRRTEAGQSVCESEMLFDLLATVDESFPRVLRYCLMRHAQAKFPGPKFVSFPERQIVEARLDFQINAPEYLKAWKPVLGLIWPPELGLVNSERWFAEWVSKAVACRRAGGLANE